MSYKESNVQIGCVRWFTLQYPDYVCFSVPNGGIRTRRNAQTLKREGVLSGVSDLIVLMPGKALFVEIKTEKGRQAATQKEFQSKVESLGFTYYVCRSIDDFVEAITKEIICEKNTPKYLQYEKL